MTTITGSKITAEDLSKVIMVKPQSEPQRTSLFSSEDLQFQESRRARKVRKLDFEVR
jgi:hypothetical protein